MPVEPPPSTFAFPAEATPDEHGRVAVGGDLEPGTLLAAYRSGIFPMRPPGAELMWWSPDPRGVLTAETLRVSPSLRRSRRRFEIRVDTAFADVIEACSERRSGEYDWITTEIQHAFVALHELGWAHSVEAWSREDPPELAGGLYGVAIGGFFGGESMFHRRTDASKVALVALVTLLHEGRGDENRFIDVQWLTPHLASLGAFEISRADYLDRLGVSLALPLPAAFT